MLFIYQTNKPYESCRWVNLGEIQKGNTDTVYMDLDLVNAFIYAQEQGQSTVVQITPIEVSDVERQQRDIREILDSLENKYKEPCRRGEGEQGNGRQSDLHAASNYKRFINQKHEAYFRTQQEVVRRKKIWKTFSGIRRI